MSGSVLWRSAALRALALGALLALVSGGPRPENGREHAEWTHRVSDAQRVQYPSLHDTQRVQIPSVDEPQRCSSGYYLDRSASAARCVRCSCNGFSDECEDDTGRCLNCADNTAGDHCERCRDGYYSSAARTRCRACPCPLSHEPNNFALGCTDSDGRLVCLCKDGYTGERCERCAPGYYGDPLVSGGRCRLCNCAGNLCDAKTGVCRNTLELQDTHTEEQCEECDNCAQTLLNDLEKLDIELRRFKEQLDLDSLRPSSKEHLRKLEEAITATTTLVNSYSFTVDSQAPKVKQLEQDVINLTEDMDNLKKQVRKQAEDSQTALANAENSHQRAEDLDTETQNLLRKIKELVKQLKDSESSGSALPSADLTKLLEQSQSLVKEMEKRSFTPQEDAARTEQTAADRFLESVKNLLKQCDENEAAAKRVDGLLSSYEAKLKELEELLKQADNTVKKTRGQNDINAQGLADVQKRVKDAERERDLVQDQMGLALKQLKDTEDALNMFNHSRSEYEQLAAQLDGAKTELQDKVQSISRAAAKEQLVKRAEEHAQNMHKLASELQEAVQNVSGRSGVQTALSGIEAYKDISDAVRAAEEAAQKAKEAADRALRDVNDGDLINRAKNLKNNGNILLKDAKNAAKGLKEADKDLSNQKERLQAAEEKKKALEKELLAVEEGLKGIQRDDIGKIIAAAKKAAAAANSSTSNTTEQLNNIKAEVNKIRITPALSNVDSVLNSVKMTVGNLSSSIPSLLDKIDEINSEISVGNNVTDNIKKIKELIEQARDAANRIVVPMKFTGQGHVELRPPQDLDDLRAYTSLTLSLQRPLISRRRRQTTEDNLFVMYLGNKNASGDYLGMALRSNILHVIYKLNGQEYDIEASSITESSSEVAVFDKIDLYRIYQDAQVIQTNQFTSPNPKSPVLKENLGDLTRNLLDLTPEKVVFYVGGYPDDFTPPASINYGKYKGCIEFSTFNEKIISLYNFKKAVDINLETPCKRQIPQTMSEFDYYEGTGYSKVLLERFSNNLQINQRVETRVKDALLLYLGDEDDDFYYSISLEKGYIVLRGQNNGNILEPVRSQNMPSLSPEKDVSIRIMAGRAFNVKVGTAGTTDTTEVQRTDVIPQKFKHYYIGGIPNSLRERYNITLPALKGCVKIGTAGGSTPSVQEKVGVSSGCTNELQVIRKAEFSLGSTLDKLHQDFSLDSVGLSLGFRSTKPNGVLLQNSKDSKDLQLSMENGYVLLRLQGSVWRSSKQYQDGEWHYLTVSGQGQNMQLRINEEDVGQRVTGSSPGPYSSSVVLGADSLEGCISNLYLRRPNSLYRAEDLSSYASSGDVFLNTCSASRSI